MGLVRIDFITIYASDFITIFASACRITMSGSGSDEEPFDGGDGGECEGMASGVSSHTFGQHPNL